MNKDRKTAEYLENLEDVKLSESSRSRMQDSLLAYARFHGVHESVRVAEESRSIEQVPQRTSLFTLFKNPKSMTAAIIVIMLIAGGGTSYAAEGAVPGEFLYTVKTEVNENVKSAFAISSEAEARLQAQLVEERLAEAQELAARGELTAETSADISTRIQSHASEAQEQNEKGEANGDYKSSAVVRASLEGSFRVYADVIAELNTQVSGNDGASLIADIRGFADLTADAQVNATATIDTSVEAQATVKATIDSADKYIAQIKVKLMTSKSEVSAQSYARVEARLSAAEEAQAEAKMSFRAEAYRVAYTNAQTAIRIANEVDTMINSMLRLQVNMNVDTVIEGVLDVRTEADEQATAQSDSENGTDTSTSPANESDDETGSSVEVDATTNTNVNTDIIDVDAQTETSVRGGLSL
jgi:hypothetical protein